MEIAMAVLKFLGGDSKEHNKVVTKDFNKI
ncbi:hypothetical protein IC3_00129 [Bacillus cereus VD142]|nr:hypothetical protein IC3_00129 [Bacillus cereus VD142]